MDRKIKQAIAALRPFAEAVENMEWVGDHGLPFSPAQRLSVMARKPHIEMELHGFTAMDFYRARAAFDALGGDIDAIPNPHPEDAGTSGKRGG